LALAFFIYQLNDKGTLVVEAAPSVKVNIANESVAIEDPQTGKKFDVTIGEHPLPSGVYQLQMADESGDYTLSSNVISIRRGDKQIVRVELKGPKEASFEMEAETVAESKPKPYKSLDEIPTLSASALSRKLGFETGMPLYPNAKVPNPSSKEGIMTWSIEPIYDFAERTFPNENGTLIATLNSSNEQMVTIRSAKGELLHLVPASDKIVDFAWSPEPNVFALAEKGENYKQVSIWKSFEDHLEVIDVILCDCDRIGWSFDGLKLALQNAKQITFIDLSRKNGVFAQPNMGITGEITRRPWSQDSRYFAAAVEEHVKVWDIRKEKLAHHFPDKSAPRFLATGNSLSMSGGEKKWEVWNIDTFERLVAFKSDRDWIAAWPAPSYKHILGVDRKNSFFIKNLETGEVTKSNLKFASKYTYSGARQDVAWSADGSRLTISTNLDGTWHSTDLESATIEKVGTFARKYVSIEDGRDDRLSVSLSSSGERITWLNDLIEGPSPVSTFDLQSYRTFPESEFLTFPDGAFCQISPNGNYVAIVGSSKESKRGVLGEAWLKDVSKVHVCAIDTGETIKTIETGQPHGLLWTPNSKSLVVSVLKSHKAGRKAEKEPNEKPVARFTKQIQQVIEKFDKDGNGTLEKAEIPQPSMMRLDSDGDGKLTKEEFVAAIPEEVRNPRPSPPWSGRNSFTELQTKIIDLESEEETLLTVVPLESANKTEFCFQKSRTGLAWDVAKPVIYGNQIVLPLFDKSRFRLGQRISQGRTRGWTEDVLGFFDTETGKLSKVVPLNEQFDGNQLQITDQMIMIGQPADNRKSSIDSFLILDRSNGNRAFATIPHWDKISEARKTSTTKELAGARLKQGMPYLSPSHPYVAVSTKSNLEIWKLDSDEGSFEIVKSFKTGAGYGSKARRITWHPTSPVVGWIRDGNVNWYDAEEDSWTTLGPANKFSNMVARADGWLLLDHGRLEHRDVNLNVTKTWLVTERLGNDQWTGAWDQCVLANGDIVVDDNKDNLRMVQLRDNRFETRAVTESGK
jgi:hypothetical protein